MKKLEPHVVACGRAWLSSVVGGGGLSRAVPCLSITTLLADIDCLDPMPCPHVVCILASVLTNRGGLAVCRRGVQSEVRGCYLGSWISQAAHFCE